MLVVEVIVLRIVYKHIFNIGRRIVLKALLVNYLSLRFMAETEFNDFVIKEMP